MAQLIPPLATSETLVSWEEYMDFTEEKMAPGNKDQKWMYAREFDPGVFVKMSYNENSLLCNLVAALIDCSKASEDMPSFKRPGLTYLGITSLRTNSQKLDNVWFYIALRAHYYLRKQFSYNPESGVIGDSLKDHEEEQKRETVQQRYLTSEQIADMESDLA